MIDNQTVKKLKQIVDRLNVVSSSLDDKLRTDIAEELVECANSISLIILRNANDRIIQNNLDFKINKA